MYLMDDVNKWIEIYRRLDEVSPEVFDCGKLCGSACCVGYNTVKYPASFYKNINWESADFDPQDMFAKYEDSTSVSASAKANKDILVFPSEYELAYESPVSREELNDIIWKEKAIKKAKQLGIYLLPGEHLLLDMMEDTSWLEIELQDPRGCNMPASWEYPVYFVNCKESPICPRKWRPIQCRTFPLKPALDENGVLELIWEDDKLPYSCPLIDHNAPIHDDFYRVTYEVWSELVQDPRIFDFVLQGC